jgi:hypothetical protein
MVVLLPAQCCHIPFMVFSTTVAVWLTSFVLRTALLRKIQVNLRYRQSIAHLANRFKLQL